MQGINHRVKQGLENMKQGFKLIRHAVDKNGFDKSEIHYTTSTDAKKRFISAGKSILK
jgi:hypothetical protein